MMKELIHSIIHDYSYFQIYGLTFVYFLFLYFGVGSLFQYLCRVLEKRNWVYKIVITDNPNKKIKSEIRHSLVSILIFGFSGVAMVFMIRQGIIVLLPESILNAIIGVIILSLWNEVHFYIIHRIMHLPFFFSRVHRIHHQSVIPTVYSVYSFHWFEALLLSTVPLVIAPFFNFSATAIFLYPLASILLNFAGHCNYRFGNGKAPAWSLIGTRHSAHHFKKSSNYGFATNFFDRIFSFNKNNKK
jgi:sterol desaturase/sphingolipid hydroxylase (fatty acid hydroxylase superfamily)